MPRIPIGPAWPASKLCWAEPYRITAVGDHDGVIRVNAPQHEYWLSTAEHMNSAAGQIELPYRKLDTICAEVGVQGYFVSKPMPAEAVRGWSKIWDDTH